MPGFVGSPSVVCKGNTWGEIEGACGPANNNAMTPAVASKSLATSISTNRVESMAALQAPAVSIYHPYGTCHKDNRCRGLPKSAGLVNALYPTWASVCSAMSEDTWTCSVPCKSGYLGSYIAQCREGVWSEPMGSCVRDTSCRGLPSMAAVNATVVSGSWAVVCPSVTADGEVCNLACNTGYLGGYTAQCKQGTFSVYGYCSNVIATSSACDVARLPASGLANADYGWECDNAYYGNGIQCKSACQKGFIGSYFSWCNASTSAAAWTRPVGSCFPDTTTCPPPPTPPTNATPNGYGEWTNCDAADGDQAYAAGQVCQMECAEGYIGNYWTWCKSGQWTTPTGSCYRDTSMCASPEPNRSLQNATGDWDCYEPGASIPDGYQCSMSCLQDFKGGYFIWCKDGRWTEPAGSCYPDADQCTTNPPVARPANATGVWACEGPYYDGQQCSMKCLPGYLGAYYTTCQAGAWSQVCNIQHHCSLDSCNSQAYTHTLTVENNTFSLRTSVRSCQAPSKPSRIACPNQRLRL